MLTLLLLLLSSTSAEVAQRTIYTTSKAPAPIGPYNQAVRLGNVRPSFSPRLTLTDPD